MALFNRREALTEPITVIANDQLVDACTPAYCREEASAFEEIDSQAEQLVEMLHEQAAAWSDELTTARVTAEEVQVKLTASADENGRRQGANYTDRRQGKSMVNRSVLGDMTHFRQTALNDIARLTGKDDFNAAFLSDGSFGEEFAVQKLDTLLSKRFVDSHEGAAKARHRAIGAITIEGDYALNPYHRPFAREILARHRLAELSRQAPDVLVSLLVPSTLADLPEATQRLIAVDIGAGSKSIIAQLITSRPTEAMDFFSYLAENNLPANIKEYARAIQLGAKALGGCDCPLNELGICRTVSDGILMSDLPLEIQKNMQAREQAAASQLMAQLRTFAAQYKVSKWWTVTASLTQEALPTASKATKKRSASNAVQQATVGSFQESLTPTKPRAEILGPESAQVSWKGGDALYEVDLRDQSAVQGILRSLMASEQFADYLAEYRSQKGMPELLRNGLELILTTPNYRDEPAIARMSYTKPFYSALDNRRGLTVWRLSGKGMPTVAGKEGNDTRIYFGARNDGRTRRVEIVKVANKRDVVKENRRGNRLS